MCFVLMECRRAMPPATQFSNERPLSRLRRPLMLFSFFLHAAHVRQYFENVSMNSIDVVRRSAVGDRRNMSCLQMMLAQSELPLLPETGG